MTWGPSAPLRVGYRVVPDEMLGPRQFMLRAVIHVPDRDHGMTMTMTPVYLMRSVTLPMPIAELIHCVERMARELYIHEMQEAFMVGGVRILDPHK